MKDYDKTEAYMLQCMRDSAHDREHIYRVLYTALDIAESEPSADPEILTAACLLHDIGRPILKPYKQNAFVKPILRTQNYNDCEVQ